MKNNLSYIELKTVKLLAILAWAMALSMILLGEMAEQIGQLAGSGSL